MNDRRSPPSPGIWPAQAGFRYLEHTADLAVEAWGCTRAETVRQILLATAALVIDPGQVVARGFQPVSLIDAPDAVSAMVQAVNEYLYLLDSEGLLAADISVEDGPLPDGGVRLKVSFVGDRLTAADRAYQPNSPPKAATYHNARLAPDRGRGLWAARVILDL
jgi:SHS2 domain-containing protein